MGKSNSKKNRREFILDIGKAGVSAAMIGGLSLEQILATQTALGASAAPINPLYDSILHIFLTGGPSQIDSFDPKPGSTNNLYPTLKTGYKDTYGNDFEITNLMPNLAAAVKSDPMIGLGAVRSVTHGTNNHQQGREYMFSYWQGSLAQEYPTFACVMAEYFKNHSFGVPSVVIEGGLSRRGISLEANLIHQSRVPLALQVATQSGSVDPLVQALKRPTGVDVAQYSRRRSITEMLNARFLKNHVHSNNRDWERATGDAFKITTANKASQAFDLAGVTLVPGRDLEEQRRLTLSKQLIIQGVPFVLAAISGHDTHSGHDARTRAIWGTSVDLGLMKVVEDIKKSGKKCLIVLSGDFGRTPNTIASGRDGRDHWGDGFSVGFISINQPKFQSAAIGQTGPDGTWRAQSGTLIDPFVPKDIGAFLYRAMGFPIGDLGGIYNIPMLSRTAPPVDRTNQSEKLLKTFGLA